MAELAVTDDAQFIKFCKANQVQFFAGYTGFNFADGRTIHLASGRQLQDTSAWNPLTYALVLDKIDLLEYIIQNSKDFQEALALGLPPRDPSNRARYTKAELINCQIETLSLMMENKSKHLAVMFNMFGPILDKKLIELVLPVAARNIHRDQVYDTIFRSQCFRGLFYEEVRSCGLSHQRDSFNKFYGKYISNAVGADEHSAKKIGEILSQPPFNFAFGCFLAADYENRRRQFRFKEEPCRLIQQCAGHLTSFDLYHLIGSEMAPEDHAVLAKAPKECATFVAEVKRKEKLMKSVEDRVKSLLTFTAKNDQRSFQKLVDSKLPREALFSLKGYQSPFQISVEGPDGKTHDLQVETADLNIFELACATGSLKIATYMLKDCHLLYKRDLNIIGGKNVHEMKHFYYCIMRKDLKMFELLTAWLSLNQAQVKELVWLLTQVKWTEGIERLLQSKLCTDMFVQLSQGEKHQFMWDMYCAPYFVADDAEDTSEQPILQPQDSRTPSDTRKSTQQIQMPKNSKQYESLLMLRKAISLCLARRPYSLAGIMMNIAAKPDDLPTVPPDDMYDQIEFAITCNENINDAELHQLIVYSQGLVVVDLDRVQEQFAATGQFGQSELQEYRDEIIFLMARIADHPSFEYYRESNEVLGKLIIPSAQSAKLSDKSSDVASSKFQSQRTTPQTMKSM